MSRLQLLLTVGGIIAIYLIYQLPRVVVENEPTAEVNIVHDFSISAEDEVAFASLLQRLNANVDNKKSINFADSLAKLHLKYQQTDSAAYYADYILNVDSSNQGKQKAALIYYEAFQLSASEDAQIKYAQMAGNLFEQLLVEDQQNNFLKNKRAMTLMTTVNPMAGVQMLREVLADEPENREATFNLGLLAMRSGQFQKAKERFEFLIQLNDRDNEARLYYGVSLLELGDQKEAKSVFETILNDVEADEALKSLASSYIEEL